MSVNCSQLLLGQYRCAPPDIDQQTQQPVGCGRDNLAKVVCNLTDGLACLGTNQSWFEQSIPCQYTNGYSFETALLLSIFLGMFGADRFYLGYPAIGLLKFATLGFLFLGQLVDIVLIALQFVSPADGSSYVIKFFGPRLTVIGIDNQTDYIHHQDSWR